MSKGLGRIQRGCLRVIEEYKAAGKRPTMLNIASEVYRVSPDRLSEAQHVATRGRWRVFCRRALFPDMEIFGSRRKGHSEHGDSPHNQTRSRAPVRQLRGPIP